MAEDDRYYGPLQMVLVSCELLYELFDLYDRQCQTNERNGPDLAVDLRGAIHDEVRRLRPRVDAATAISRRGR